MKILTSQWSNRVTVFLWIFAISLFLGDGRQTGIDVYWALVTIATSFQWEWRRRQSTLPQPLFVVGLFLLITSLMSTIFSWNPGYSISAMVRTIVAATWFLRFSTATEKELSSFTNDCVLLGLLLGPITLLALLVPAIPRFLPPLNLIALPSGHLPIAYVALAFLPIIATKTQEGQQNRVVRLSFISIVLAVLLSFSRAAIVLMGLFLLFGLPKSTWRPKPVMILSAAAGIIAIFSVFSPTLLPRYVDPFIPKAWRSYLVKPENLLTNSRLEYISQAVQAFRQSPLLGTGPGTFALASKQFASSSALVSSYAHNILVQTLAEYGIIGIILFTATILYFALLWLQGRNAFITSSLLTLLLATVEQSLDRYGILIFLGVCLGIVVSLSRSPLRSLSTPWLSPLLITILVLYAASWLGSDVAAAFHNPELAYQLAPYRQTLALNLITKNPMSEQSTHKRFFPRDPDIDARLARSVQDIEQRSFWYRKAIGEFPSDTFIEKDYLAFLLTLENPFAVCQELLRWADIGDVNCADQPLWILVNSVETSLPLLASHEGPSQFFYGVGLGLMVKPAGEQLAIELWQRARYLAPNWGYYHVELASLVAAHNQSYQAAVPTLLRCLSNQTTKGLCQYMLDHLKELPAPGTFAKEIFAIPVVIDTNP